MYISKIKIKNFRSIKKLEFEPNKLCTLVGANSSGKTNILKAINILIGETYPTERAFKREDFYNRDTSQPIIIEIELSNELSSVKLTKAVPGSPKEFAKIKKLKLIHKFNDSGSSTDFRVFNASGDEFYGNGEVRDQINFIYIPSDRNLEKQLSVSQWTLLGKILKKVDHCFRKIEENEDNFKEAMIKPLELLDGNYNDTNSFKSFKIALEKQIKLNLKGHANDCNLKLDIYDPLWYYKTLQIQVDEKGNLYNVNEIGSGTQNLILISIFQIYSQYCDGNTIFGFEEPELYLFPNAQRSLYKSFNEISPHSQIIYTTHSPLFLSVKEAENVIMLKKLETGTSKMNLGSFSELIDNQEKNEVHLLTKFSSDRNEIFFADYVILVEGETEEKTLPHIIDKLIPNESINYTIINCQSKDFIPFFIKVCKYLGINKYFVIFDTDQDPKKSIDAKNSGQLSTNKIIQLLSPNFISTNTLALDYDFESVCGYLSPKKEKILNALNWVTNLNQSEIPEVFNKLKLFLKEEIVDQLTGNIEIKPKVEENFENIDLTNFTSIDVNMPF